MRGQSELGLDIAMASVTQFRHGRSTGFSSQGSLPGSLGTLKKFPYLRAQAFSLGVCGCHQVYGGNCCRRRQLDMGVREIFLIAVL